MKWFHWLWLTLPSIFCLALSTVPLQAQEVHGFTPCAATQGAQSVSANGTSANIQLSKCGPSVLLYNVGSNEAFYNLGTSSGTLATASNYSIPANSFIILTVPYLSQPYLAFISSSGTTIRVSQGNVQ